MNNYETNQKDSTDNPLNQYPFIPPKDSQLIIPEKQIQYEIIDSSKPSLKSTKICCICDYPIIVRVYLIPCQHFMCYSCYRDGGNKCLFCKREFTQMVRIEDNAQFYTCGQLECQMYFDSEYKLKAHQNDVHIQISTFESKIAS